MTDEVVAGLARGLRVGGEQSVLGSGNSMCKFLEVRSSSKYGSLEGTELCLPQRL